MERKNQGFTLIEVIVSLGLLVMIIGLLPLTTIIQNSNTYSSGSTAMTNIAMSLSESLNMTKFADVGADPFVNCLDDTGLVDNGSSQGVCKEGPLNQLGQTSNENAYFNLSNDNVYFYYRFSVICSNTLNLPGGYTGSVCSMPNSNLQGGPVVNDLKCVAANYTNLTKEVKVLVAYSDKYGKCKKLSLSSWKVGYDY